MFLSRHGDKHGRASLSATEQCRRRWWPRCTGCETDSKSTISVGVESGNGEPWNQQLPLSQNRLQMGQTSLVPLQCIEPSPTTPEPTHAVHLLGRSCATPPRPTPASASAAAAAAATAAGWARAWSIRSAWPARSQAWKAPSAFLHHPAQPAARTIAAPATIKDLDLGHLCVSLHVVAGSRVCTVD